MKTFLEAVCILCLLAVIGIAGGLETGRATVTGALIAWGVVAGIATIAGIARVKAR